MARKCYSKAKSVIDRALNPPKQFSEEEIAQALPSLYPHFEDEDIDQRIKELYSLLSSEGQPLRGEHDLDIDFSPSRLTEIISSCCSATTPGPSSCGFEWLKKLSKITPFLKALQSTYTSLLQHPFLMMNIPELFQFNDIYVEKSNGKPRPIAVEESMLSILNKIILQAIRPEFQLCEHQYALAKQAQIRCIKRAREIYKSKQLLTIDITNAFNSLPWPVIYDAMCRAGFASNIREYIMNYLQFRWNERVGQT